MGMRTAVSLLVLGGLMFGVGPVAQSQPAAQPATAAKKQATAADKAFIDRMVPHHQMGVAMADLAIARATHPELKAFARKMREQQQKDIKELKTSRAQWFGSAETPPMDESKMPHLPTGKDFDVEWAQLIAMHHQGAIDMARLALASPGHPKIDEMANRMIPAQEKDQKQLMGYVHAWR